DYGRTFKARSEHPLEEARLQRSSCQIETECSLRLDLFQAVRKAIEACTAHVNPTRDALAIHYYFHRGFKIDEIAKELGANLQEIRGLINRTKRDLRKSPFLMES